MTITDSTTTPARAPGTVPALVGHPVCGKVGCSKPAVAEILLPRYGTFYEAFACEDHRDAGATIGEFVMPNAQGHGSVTRKEKENV